MKNPTDPIIEEIHATRRAIAQRFGYDVHQISQDANRRQMLEGRPVWRPELANKSRTNLGLDCAVSGGNEQDEGGDVSNRGDSAAGRG